MKKKVFISKVFAMSFVMFSLNISGICYSIFVSQRAGAAGIGMFHLVMSVYSFALVFSISGMGLTTTRLISDMPSSLAVKCADAVVIKCLRMCLVPSLLAFAVLFSASDVIAGKILGNSDASYCLKIMAPSLVFTAISSVTNGYFTSFGKIVPIAVGRLCGDAVVWGTTLVLLGRYDTDKTYMAVVVAFCAGVITESVCLLYLWNRAGNSLYCKKAPDTGRVLSLCMPLAFGSYLRTGLVSCENLLIPTMLSIFGSANPLASYGIIKGMTLPILTFPTVFTGAFTSLIVPEMARRRSCGMKNSIRYISALSVKYILRFAVFISAVFLRWHSDISSSFFKEPDAGVYLGLLWLFPVFMLLDSVVDSILKGMDKQLTSLGINIVDSACRVAFIFAFVPRFGMKAYITIMYASEIVNLVFSYKCLRGATKLSFPLKDGLALPVLSAVVGMWLCKFLPFENIWAHICFFAACYIVFLVFFSKCLQLFKKSDAGGFELSGI